MARLKTKRILADDPAKDVVRSYVRVSARNIPVSNRLNEAALEV
jgi:hypothetical protein